MVCTCDMIMDGLCIIGFVWGVCTCNSHMHMYLGVYEWVKERGREGKSKYWGSSVRALSEWSFYYGSFIKMISDLLLYFSKIL